MKKSSAVLFAMLISGSVGVHAEDFFADKPAPVALAMSSAPVAQDSSLLNVTGVAFARMPIVSGIRFSDQASLTLAQNGVAW